MLIKLTKLFILCTFFASKNFSEQIKRKGLFDEDKNFWNTPSQQAVR